MGLRMMLICGLLSSLTIPGCAADAICSGGGSGCLTCPHDQGDCNQDPTDGCETNFLNNPKNCGRCDKACPGITQQKALCIEGQCGICEGETRDCNNSGDDGCETSIALDPKNCGACGTTCPAVPNGVPGCLMGACILERCLPGFQDCDGAPANGCETDVRMDTKNCGNCGQQCPTLATGTVVCQDGACVLSKCAMGFDSCNTASPVQSCETSLLTDIDNCGRCGVACPTVANDQRACVNGACTSKPCEMPRWQNCNGSAADGCETDTSKDPTHCGNCMTKCTPMNGTGGCVAGTCKVFKCNSGYGDCDLNAANGCEADLNTRTDSCGVCNLNCTINAALHVTSVDCKMGQCTVSTCQAVGTQNFLDCDGLFNNGCETDVNASTLHCGVCNNPCPKKAHAIPGCVDAVCQGVASCETGFGDCDTNPQNGCEVDLRTSRFHCGGCGKPCNVTDICSNGRCVRP